jgi:hypothetical protein
MNGDKAIGPWTPWPVSPDQLELAEDDSWESEPEDGQGSDQGEHNG